MYESFFRMSQRPFAATPHVAQYYPAECIETARRTLVRCIDRAEGVGVVIGPSGTGKTLLCALLEQQFADRFEVVQLGSTRILEARALLQAVLFEIGLPCRGLDDGELRLALVDHLTGGHAARKGMLIVADEAHTLPARVLEELRLITNISVGGEPRVRLVLAGSPALEEHLASPRLASFSQRTAARCYLGPLDRHETGDYVTAQIAGAGADGRRIFNDAALSAIYRATDGIPRLINQLCDHALVLSFSSGIEHLGEAEIETAWADLQQLPTPWSGAARQERHEASPVVEFGALDDEEEEMSIDFDAPGPRLALGLSDEELPAEDVFESLEPLDEQFASIEVGAAPRGATSVEMAHTSNPFAESFAEEEIVVDRFPSCTAAIWDQMPHVYSVEGRLLASLLEPLVETAARPAEAAANQQWADTAEPALVIIEDDPVVAGPPRPHEARAHRQEYSQLFAKLRRG